MEAKGLNERICDLLSQDRPVAVATILSREGSAPRMAGSKMVIEPGGSFTGTIGGGKFEADVLSAADEALDKGRPQKLFFDLTSDDAAGMDMICGGAMRVLVDVLQPTADDRALCEAWREAQEKPTAAVLATAIASDAAGGTRTDHCMVYADGRTDGPWRPSAELLARLLKIAGQGGPSRLLEAHGDQVLVEPTTPPVTLLIFGAGHVSMPTARMAADVGFRVIVADDRSAFANRGRFAEVDDVVVIADYSSALSRFGVDENTYVVIVTRGHRHDKSVLAQSLKTKAGYIGMIGSRRKRDTLYAALTQEGFSDEDFSRVYCPIGLSIGADTPEEIAVSIVAQLIAHRSGAVSLSGGQTGRGRPMRLPGGATRTGSPASSY